MFLQAIQQMVYGTASQHAVGYHHSVRLATQLERQQDHVLPRAGPHRPDVVGRHGISLQIGEMG